MPESTRPAKAGLVHHWCFRSNRSALGDQVLRQLEGPEHAALVEVLHPLGHFAAPQRYRTAPAGEYGDILLAVHFPGNRGAEHAGTGLELPDLVAGLGIEGLQEALGRSGEYQVALGGHHPAPQWREVLVTPDFLTGFRVDGAQHADVVLVQRTDGKTGTEVGRALLVGDPLVPDVHAPFVGRHIEQAGVLAVGHRHPVLRAEEGRCGEYRTALGLATRRTRAVGLVVDRPAVLVQALGPGDLVDEGEAANELAVGAVEHVEETV